MNEINIDQNKKQKTSKLPKVMIRWLWLLVTVLWCALVGIILQLQIEPLTGFTIRGFFIIFLVQVVLVGSASFLYFNRGKFIVGTVIGIIALVSSPVILSPSMSGVKLEFQNQTETEGAIIVRRTDVNSRMINLVLPAGQKTVYTTGAGDWPNNASFSIGHGNNKLTARVTDFRNTQIIIDSKGISLKPFK